MCVSPPLGELLGLCGLFSWSREGCSDSQRGAGLCGVSVAGRRLLLSGSARLVGSVGPFHSRLWRPGRAKTSGPAAQVLLAGVSWCLVPEEARALPEGAPPRLYGFLCVPRLLLRSVFLLSDSGGFLSRTCSSGSALGCCSAAPQVPAALASPPSICGGLPAGPWLLLPSSHTSVIFPNLFHFLALVPYLLVCLPY